MKTIKDFYDKEENVLFLDKRKVNSLITETMKSWAQKKKTQEKLFQKTGDLKYNDVADSFNETIDLYSSLRKTIKHGKYKLSLNKID